MPAELQRTKSTVLYINNHCSLKHIDGSLSDLFQEHTRHNIHHLNNCCPMHVQNKGDKAWLSVLALVVCSRHVR